MDRDTRRASSLSLFLPSFCLLPTVETISQLYNLLKMTAGLGPSVCRESPRRSWSRCFPCHFRVHSSLRLTDSRGSEARLTATRLLLDIHRIREKIEKLEAGVQKHTRHTLTVDEFSFCLCASWKSLKQMEQLRATKSSCIDRNRRSFVCLSIFHS